jgi:hypothetical protein
MLDTGMLRTDTVKAYVVEFAVLVSEAKEINTGGIPPFPTVAGALSTVVGPEAVACS